jgi:CubicO group peptidase (beta-lactamase class C family)
VQKTNALDDLMEEALAKKIFPGAVCALVVGGRVRYQGAWGDADSESKKPAAETTIYDLASLTKPVATATTLMLALERGLLTLETPVSRYFDNAGHLKDVTVRHLITHTGGLPAWRPIYKQAKGRDESIQAVLNVPLDRKPGDGYTYSDLGYILLGAIIEKVFERPLNELVREQIAVPLGMNDTGFNPPDETQAHIAPTANCSMREGKILKGEVHDANAAVMEGVAGHAGLFSTLEDLIRYAQMLLRGGRPLLAYYTVQQMLAAQVTLPGQSLGWHTLGFFAHPNSYLPRGDIFPTRCVGHSGFTGTVLLLDPQVELGIILLTNHVYYSDEKTAYLDYRRRILNVLAALASKE